MARHSMRSCVKGAHAVTPGQMIPDAILIRQLRGSNVEREYWAKQWTASHKLNTIKEGETHAAHRADLYII